MPVFVPLAIAFGLLGGGLAAYRATEIIRRYFSARSSSPRLVAAFATSGAILALLPVGFLAFVVGGTLGGGYLSAVFGELGAPIGIAGGIFLVFAVGVTCTTTVCALVGRLVAHLVYGRAAT